MVVGWAAVVSGCLRTSDGLTILRCAVYLHPVTSSALRVHITLLQAVSFVLRCQPFHPQRIRNRQLSLHLERCVQANADFDPVLHCTGLRVSKGTGYGESSAEDQIHREVVLFSMSRKISIAFRVIHVQQIYVECRDGIMGILTC
jgi:hypothetical protein